MIASCVFSKIAHSFSVSLFSFYSCKTSFSSESLSYVRDKLDWQVSCFILCVAQISGNSVSCEVIGSPTLRFVNDRSFSTTLGKYSRYLRRTESLHTK